MCFGSTKDEEQNPPPHPVSIQQQQKPSSSSKMNSNNPFFNPPQAPTQHQQQHYAPPQGPPPQQQYAPPPGPPPQYAPSPPAFFESWDRSPGDNATEAEARAGTDWCAVNPLMGPLHLQDAALQALQQRNINLIAPKKFKGTLTRRVPGVWSVQTPANTPDSTLISYPPLYHVLSAQAPLWRQERVTVYYEVRIFRANHDRDASVALGFSALPYPGFRLPGWHRGSLAVHGDDGHRFINDMWGGKSFTAPFHAGETLGLGMSFRHPGNTGKCRNVEVFFTRDGKEAGRWDLHEELDAEQDLPVDGLEGNLDLAATVGVYKDMDIEVIFAPERMLYSWA